MRLAVICTSGSGKSTFAKSVAKRQEFKHIEQDKFFWKPDWVQVSKEEFGKKMSVEISGENWAVCGNHSSYQRQIWERCTHIVWLNYPFRVVFYRALIRTVGRVFLKKECCNGNVEGFRQAFMSKDSILWWVYTTHKKRIDIYESAIADGRFDQVEFSEIRSQKEADDWIQAHA